MQANTLLEQLSDDDRTFVHALSERYQLTFQQQRLVTHAARDFQMWQEEPLFRIWKELEDKTDKGITGRRRRNELLKELRQRVTELERQPSAYSPKGMGKPSRQPLELIEAHVPHKKILGFCPAASEQAVCCNLRTLDIVDGCSFGCSYCTIQSFYGNRIQFDDELVSKLRSLDLDSNLPLHITTGQSSDSLAWGNKHGILDALCDFAARHPNLILELKTKSDRVGYLLERPVPRNVVCSWSLNPETIIINEEHFTASVDKRLAAARSVADHGIKVGFHFHPIVHYDRWEEDYDALVQQVLSSFSPDEVVFVTLGTLTFIKPVIKEIRKRGWASRILQMEMVPDHHGKLTYGDELKTQLYRSVFRALEPWHQHVFAYLCMEPPNIWDDVFGWHYDRNDDLERAFWKQVMAKLRS